MITKRVRQIETFNEKGGIGVLTNDGIRILIESIIPIANDQFRRAIMTTVR